MKALLKSRKGATLGDAYPMVLTIVLVGIVLGIGLYVLAEIEPNLSDSGNASEAINDTIEGLGDFSDWIAVIVVVIAAAIVLGVVLSSFGSNRGV
jgi:type II secretory pathway component PulF